MAFLICGLAVAKPDLRTTLRIGWTSRRVSPSLRLPPSLFSHKHGSGSVGRGRSLGTFGRCDGSIALSLSLSLSMASKWGLFVQCPSPKLTHFGQAKSALAFR